MLLSYGVTPLKEDHFEERCADITDQVKNGTITLPLFIMALVPEGNPVWDKASNMIKLYDRYRDVLQKQGINCGILVQASLGHGYPLTENPFQRYVNLTDGKEQFVCCPEDDAFIEHFCDVLKRLAAHKPAVIMLDDDFRMIMRPGKGCACPRHMKLFNDATGLNMTRQELWEHISTHGNDEITEAFVKTQNNSLLKTAKAFRAAIDSIDPSVQGINCTSGYVCEESWKTNAVFSGKGNPTAVRIPNGIYAPNSVRGFSDLMRRTVICKSKLKKRGIEYILAETDTIPFNRYAKSARYLHAQYTAAIIDGCVGAKHWLTRTTAFEPDSGKAYRAILAEHKSFYEALTEIASDISWVGIGHAYVESNLYKLAENVGENHKASFISSNIERMGIPFYYTENGGKAVFLEGNVVRDMSDGELARVFESSVLMTAQAAEDVIKRGYGKQIGVEISEYTGKTIQCESYTGSTDQCCTAQKHPKLITVNDSSVEILSYNIRRNRSEAEIMSPAVTCLRRKDGKLSVVFCGDPDASFDYYEGFAFLNESRKAQLTALLTEAGALPIYCVGDPEICLRAGYIEQTLLACIYPLGIDPQASLQIYLEKAPVKISLLQSNGTKKEVGFASVGNNIYDVDVKLEAMYPVILFIE